MKSESVARRRKNGIDGSVSASGNNTHPRQFPVNFNRPPVFLCPRCIRVRQTRVERSSTRTLDCGVIIFDELASHEANGESGLSDTSGFTMKLMTATRDK